MVRFQDGGVALLPCAAQFVGLVYLKDAVLLDDADQHEQTEHGVKVHRRAEQEQRQQAERDGHGQSCHDADRVQPALKLPRQDQVHEQDAQDQSDQEVITCLAQHLGLAAKRDLVAWRKVHFLDDGLSMLYGLLE